MARQNEELPAELDREALLPLDRELYPNDEDDGRYVLVRPLPAEELRERQEQARIANIEAERLALKKESIKFRKRIGFTVGCNGREEAMIAVGSRFAPNPAEAVEAERQEWR